MKKLLTIALLVLSLLPCFAANIVYLRVPSADAPAILAKLNTLIVITPTTTDYTKPINPVTPGSTNDVLIPVEESTRVKNALDDIELWNARLASIPAEFVPEMSK